MPHRVLEISRIQQLIGYNSTVSLEGILERVVVDLRENLRADRISRHGSTG